MKGIINRLWNEYYMEKCSEIGIEERTSVRRVSELHGKLNEELSAEQRKSMEKLIECIYESEAYFRRKAFIMGCELGASFVAEACADHE